MKGNLQFRRESWIVRIREEFESQRFINESEWLCDPGGLVGTLVALYSLDVDPRGEIRGGRCLLSLEP